MRKPYLFILFAVIYEFAVYSANDMIMPAMPKVIAEFNAPLSYVALSLSLYMLGECFVQLFVGPIAERFGKRKIVIYGSFSFIIFTLVIMFSNSINQFMIARFLQGSGLAYIAMCYALIHEKFNDKDAVKMISLMTNVGIMAPLIGPVLGGLVLNYTDNWHYIFVFIAILGLIGFLGLFRYTPNSKTRIEKLNLTYVFSHYKEIWRSPNFKLGLSCIAFNAAPLLIWIGLAPNMLLHNLKLSYNEYIVYQLIAIGGMSIATIMVQIVAGKWRFQTMIKFGSYISVSGMLFGLICYQSIELLAIGLFFYSFGLGLSNGSIWRIVMSNNQVSQSMSASLITFSQTLFLAIAIESSNLIGSKFNYSTLSFALTCFGFTVISAYLITRFANNNAKRQWQ